MENPEPLSPKQKTSTERAKDQVLKRRESKRTNLAEGPISPGQAADTNVVRRADGPTPGQRSRHSLPEHILRRKTPWKTFL